MLRLNCSMGKILGYHWLHVIWEFFPKKSDVNGKTCLKAKTVNVQFDHYSKLEFVLKSNDLVEGPASI